MYVFSTGDHMAGWEGGGGWVEQHCKHKINCNLYLAVLFACLWLFLFCFAPCFKQYTRACASRTQSHCPYMQNLRCLSHAA